MPNTSPASKPRAITVGMTCRGLDRQDRADTLIQLTLKNA